METTSFHDHYDHLWLKLVDKSPKQLYSEDREKYCTLLRDNGEFGFPAEKPDVSNLKENSLIFNEISLPYYVSDRKYLKSIINLFA